MLTSKLELSNRKHQDAEKEVTELQKSVDDMKPRLSKSQDKMKELKDQVWSVNRQEINFWLSFALDINRYL